MRHVTTLRGRHEFVAADLLEVVPTYDHAEITALAWASVVYELINLFANIAK